MAKKVSLPNVTLVVVSSVKMDQTIYALNVSRAGIDFHDIVLISDQRPANLPAGITWKTCDPITSIDSYSKFMVFDLARYIKTDFALVIQYDGYVLRPNQWRAEFLNYDYIGAPWEPGAHFTKAGTEVRVGNGGFSLRSKKLLNALNDLHLPFTNNGTDYYNEDGIICNYYRSELEAYGIRYAPVDVASRFSRENDCPDSFPTPFGFHKNQRLIPKLFTFRHRMHGISK